MNDERVGGGRGPWIMQMTWHDLLFAHWRVEPAVLRPHVPEGLEIETFDGAAWIGVVPFYMNGVRGRCLPPVPTTYAFPELNVRTYVTDGESRGVWFFSLDAASFIAVQAARWSFNLNYKYARMRYEPSADDGWVRYRSDRAVGEAKFQGRYRPVGDAYYAEPGSLESFLTDRFCLFAATSRDRIWRGDISHEPWPLHRAEAEITLNTMTEQIDLPLEGEPHLLYATNITVHAWPPVRVKGRPLVSAD